MPRSRKSNKLASTLGSHTENEIDDTASMVPALAEHKKGRKQKAKKAPENSNNSVNDMSNQDFDRIIAQSCADNHRLSNTRPSSPNPSVSFSANTLMTPRPTTNPIRVVSMRLVNTPTPRPTASEAHSTLQQIQQTIARLEAQEVMQRAQEIVQAATAGSIPEPVVASSTITNAAAIGDGVSNPSTPDSLDEIEGGILTPAESTDCQNVKSRSERQRAVVARSASYPLLSIERKTSTMRSASASKDVTGHSAWYGSEHATLLQDVDNLSEVPGSVQKQEDYVSLREVASKIESLQSQLTPAQYKSVVQDVLDAYERGVKMVQQGRAPDGPIMAFVRPKPSSRATTPRSAPPTLGDLKVEDSFHNLLGTGSPVKLSVKLTDLENVLHEEALLKPTNVLREAQTWDDPREVSSVVEDRFEAILME